MRAPAPGNEYIYMNAEKFYENKKKKGGKTRLQFYHEKRHLEAPKSLHANFT